MKTPKEYLDYEMQKLRKKKVLHLIGAFIVGDDFFTQAALQCNADIELDRQVRHFFFCYKGFKIYQNSGIRGNFMLPCYDPKLTQ